MADQFRIPRSDTLPENAKFPDLGCRMAPSCLGCHLPICIEDDPNLNTRLRKADRDRAVIKAYAEGVRPRVLAAKHGISSRTVHRIIQMHRDGRRATVWQLDPKEKPDITLEELSARTSFRAPTPWPELRS